MATRDQLNRVVASLYKNVNEMGETDAWQALLPERAEQIIRNPELLQSWFVPMLAEWARYLVGKDEYFPMEGRDSIFPLGDGHGVWRGSYKDSGNRGEERQDVRSLAVKAFRVSDLIFDKMDDDSAQGIQIGKRFQKLIQEKAEFIRVDADIARRLHEEGDQRTLEWIRTRLGYTRLFFPGTEFCTNGNSDESPPQPMLLALSFSQGNWHPEHHIHSRYTHPNGDAWLLMKPLEL